MKKLKTQYWSLLVASIFSACSSLPKADKAVLSTPSVSATIGIPKDEELRSDTTSTYVRFIGHGVGHSHAGQFKLKEGKVQLQGQNLVGGYFVIDIQSMKLEDQSSGVQQKLRPHLLSSDFFNVQKYPYAMFNIYKTEPYHGHSVLNANYMVSGGLTMKGVTRSISF
ncbi:MAG TPA: YceI family protein, partial [Flavisolibacter sp.]|nr:YceI family protein [Flavisolibacter sp.]